MLRLLSVLLLALFSFSDTSFSETDNDIRAFVLATKCDLSLQYGRALLTPP